MTELVSLSQVLLMPVDKLIEEAALFGGTVIRFPTHNKREEGRVRDFGAEQSASMVLHQIRSAVLRFDHRTRRLNIPTHIRIQQKPHKPERGRQAA